MVVQVDHSAVLCDAAPVSYWLDDPTAPPSAPPLVGRTTADLTVVGGGYTGLWTALLSKEAEPDRDVLVLESDRCGWAASGSNGGFCSASLTHGLSNGATRFPDEITTLERLGKENLNEIEAKAEHLPVDCDFERTGEMTVATEPYQVESLLDAADLAQRYGDNRIYLDQDRVRAEVDSPTFVAGIWDRDGCALVNPARLAWGLRRACEDLGVRLYEHSRVDRLDSRGDGEEDPLVLRTEHGQVSSRRVALATNAYPPLIRRLRRYVVPVYDYALMTEPLRPEQLGEIGWGHRQGTAGCGNQFLYYRLSRDNRILFGGYDAIYHFGNGLRPSLEQRESTFMKLASLFVKTFPQLDGLRFTHAWAGAVDTCSRFCSFFDRSHGGRVVSVAGYTGLGVAASRFGARVMLDLVSGQETGLTRLQFVRKKPMPFPPEPIRYAGVQLTRWSMAGADRNAGRRNAWLRTLDRFGMGFDS